MKLKECGSCSLFKPVNEFYRRKLGFRSGQYYEKCIVCMKARGVKYYHSHHERQLQLALARRQKAYKIKRDFIAKQKEQPCADCGIKYPYFVMDFDHKEGQNKLGNIATITSRNWSLDKIKTEVKKCDVVCANCHRLRTHSKLAEVAKVVTAGL